MGEAAPDPSIVDSPSATAAEKAVRRADLKPTLLIALMLVGAIVVPLTVSGFHREFFVADARSSIQAYVVLWALALAAQGALWIACIIWLLRLPGRLRARLENQWAKIRPGAWLFEVVLPVLLVGGTLVGILGITASPDFPPKSVGEHPVSHLQVPSIVGFILATTFSGAELYAGALLEAIFEKQSDLKVRVETIIVLRTLMDRCLAGAALVLGLGIVATAAIRGAEDFAKEYVMAYGATYSIALLIIYVVARRPFQAAGQALVDDLAPLSAESIKVGWNPKDWQEKRSGLTSLLQLEVTARSLGPVVSTLLPVLLGLLTGLMPKG